MDNNQAVSQMLTKTHATKLRDREITRVWKSEATDLETLEHTNEQVGVQVELEVRHDASNKQFIASLRKVHWKPSETAGITITFMSPFDRTNYPYATVMRVPVSRYSEKALKAFEQSVIAELPKLADQHQVIADLIGIANRI
jgi:hypothetical protein